MSLPISQDKSQHPEFVKKELRIAAFSSKFDKNLLYTHRKKGVNECP